MHAETNGTVYKIPIVDALNSFVTRIGEIAAWANVILIAIILVQVTLRYGFNNGLVPLEELIWHLYAVAMMFGLSYAMVQNSHIRVDLIHMNLSSKTQHIIEILGISLLLLPFLWTIIDHSIAWVYQSYEMGEASSSPTGLSHRWIIKSVLPLSLSLLFIAAVARLIRSFVLLKHKAGNLGTGLFSVTEEITSQSAISDNEEK